MPKRGSSTDRRRQNPHKTVRRLGFPDRLSILQFLTGSVDFEHPLVCLILSNRVTNSLPWTVFESSNEAVRTQLLIEERNRLKSESSLKTKGLLLNRLIHASETPTSRFHEHVTQAAIRIHHQLSDAIRSANVVYPVAQVYEQVNAWRTAQCTRRLYYQDSYPPCSILSLQRLVTSRFVNIVDFYQQSPDLFRADNQVALIELLQHALIIVEQPGGSDCPAVAKYEKVSDGFFLKLKTRIISLLDAVETQNYLTISNAEVILESKDDDSPGDRLEPFAYNTRTVLSNENGQHTFSFAELKGTEFLRLTRLHGNVTINGESITIPIEQTSQWFGVCSHSQFYSEYLAKVLLTEINQLHPKINPETHLDILQEYIALFYRRMTGVPMQLHTRKFVSTKLQTLYQQWQDSGSLPNTPVMFLSWDVYEKFLTKLFVQIRCLNTQPYLAIMYHDNLFRGITSDDDAQTFASRTLHGTQMLLRFEDFSVQNTTTAPQIAIAMYNGTLSTSTTSLDQLLNYISRQCHSSHSDSVQMFSDDVSLPFNSFRYYHNHGMSGDVLLQDLAGAVAHPLDLFADIPTQENLVNSTFSQESNSQAFCLLGQLTGDPELKERAIADLQAFFKQWCGKHNTTGQLSQAADEPAMDTSDASSLSLFDDPWFLNETESLLPHV